MKASVKYLVRAVKNFCWFVILFTLLIGILVLTKFVPADINTMFIKGWVSVAEIAGVFLVFSALYPKFGYQSRKVSITGEWKEVQEKVREFFDQRGDYVVESAEDGKICFRSKSRAIRIARLWEDRITVTFVLGGVEMEGPAKDLSRIVSAFEYYLRGE